MEPRQFGNYTLLERVSHGGMAEVFRAKSFGEAGFEREVALKLLLPSIASDKEFVDMLIDEAKIAGQLNHANIAQIFDLGAVDGRYFIVQEFVKGQDLRAVLKHKNNTQTKLKISTACHIAIKISEGLHYAHNKQDHFGKRLNLVHRDISPHNILISDEGEVKIIDFGIAKADGRSTQTMAGLVKGKFAYMSPEQIRGLPVDHRSDVFATGILLHEMLTSRPLFQARTEFETLKRARAALVQPPSYYNSDVPPELDAISLKALARHVDDRYQSAQDLRDDLWAFARANNAFAGHEQLANMAPGVGDHPGSSMRLELASEVREVPEDAAPARAATTNVEPQRQSTAPAQSLIADEYASPATETVPDDYDDDPSENRTVVDPHFAGIAIAHDGDDDFDARWAADVDGPLPKVPSISQHHLESDPNSPEEEETTSSRGLFAHQRSTDRFSSPVADHRDEATAPGPLERDRRASTLPSSPRNTPMAAGAPEQADPYKQARTTKQNRKMAFAETEPVSIDLLRQRPTAGVMPDVSPLQVGRSRPLQPSTSGPVPTRSPPAPAPTPHQHGSAPAPMPQQYGSAPAPMPQQYGSAPAPMPQPYRAPQQPYESGAVPMPRPETGSAPFAMPAPAHADASTSSGRRSPTGAGPRHTARQATQGRYLFVMTALFLLLVAAAATITLVITE